MFSNNRLVSFLFLIAVLASISFYRYTQWHTLPETEPVIELAPTPREERPEKKDAYRENGPEQFAEFHRRIRTRAGEQYPAYEPAYRLKAYRKSLSRRPKSGNAEPLPWVERGPGNVGGRTRGLWVDPSDTTHLTWLAGSVGGGVWKTTDGGNTWRHLTEDLTNLSTSTIAGAATNPKVLYAGTGEGFPGGFVIMGNGIWKSTDGGETWAVLESTVGDPRFTSITRIVVNPADENEIVAATRVTRRLEREDGDPLSYIMKSTDGGETWTQTLRNTSSVAQQLVIHPNTFDTLYAVINGAGLALSTDGGDSWEAFYDATDLEVGRIEMAISPTVPNIQYFAAYANDGASRLYRSTDYGKRWNEVVGRNARNDFGRWMAGQGWYNNSIVVHPFDPNTVFVGGAGPILRITVTDSEPDFQGKLEGEMEPVVDGYAEYRDRFDVTSKGVHVDHHNLIAIPIDSATGRFYFLSANDGGVAFSEDSGETFTQTGDLFSRNGFYPTYIGYNTAQFYGVDKMNGAERYVGGTQDNGSWVSRGNPNAVSRWRTTPGGDGFEAAWHYENPDLILESSQGNVVYRSDNRGRNWRNVSPPGNGPFLTRIANSKIDPDMVFCVARQGVVRSLDFGNTWEVITMPEGWNYGGNTTQVSISLTSPLIVWSGSGMTENSRLAVSRDGGATFEAVNAYDGATLGAISGLETHPADEATAFALFSMADGPKILRTTDFGETWTDISGFNGNVEESNNGFPDVATYSLLVMPFDANRLWAGTEIGLFESLDGGESWQYADNGLPPVAIWEMKVVNDEIVLATHGRGVWTVSMPELEGYEPPAPSALLPQLKLTGSGLGGVVTGEYFLRSVYDSSFVSVEILNRGEVASRSRFDLTQDEAPVRGNFEVALESLPQDTAIEATVEIFSYKNGIELINRAKALVFEVEPEAITEYQTDFDDGRADFARLGFNIYQEAGFDGKALHSVHPYEGFYQTYFAVFQYPVVVSETNPVITFDEIVMVEPGEPGAAFGELEFWDFVAVQGTRDRGLTWDTIQGYDSRRSPEWESFYDPSGTAPDGSLFEKQVIDLSTRYQPGDTIFLRFLLQSDPYVEGWGWVIDNLNIQGEPTNSREIAGKPMLDIQAFPNPANDFIRLHYELEERQPVRIELHNIRGQRLSVVERQVLPAGPHQREVDVRHLTPGVYLFRLVAGERVRTVKWVKR